MSVLRRLSWLNCGRYNFHGLVKFRSTPWIRLLIYRLVSASFINAYGGIDNRDIHMGHTQLFAYQYSTCGDHYYHYNVPTTDYSNTCKNNSANYPHINGLLSFILPIRSEAIPDTKPNSLKVNAICSIGAFNALGSTMEMKEDRIANDISIGLL